MGLFDMFRAIKNTAAAGGNYNYIAQNFATQYYVFSHTDYSFSLFMEERLFAVAAINTMIPLQHNDIHITSIADAVINSEHCEVSLPGYSRKWRNDLSEGEYERLFNVLLQIEALTFKAYSKQDDKTIVLQVLSHMDSIFEIFKTTLKQGMTSPLYKDVNTTVVKAVNDPEFRNLVSKYFDYCYD